MDTIIYPLVYYRLSDEALLGILVGTRLQMVDRDIRNLKSSLSDYLFKQYKKYDDYPYVGISEPKLKVFEVKVRPTYREEYGSFPYPVSVKIPVVAVYGPNGRGYYECYLPTLDEHFYYYNPKELTSLVNHFSTNTLNQLEPEELHRIQAYGKPEMETISLKVNYQRDFDKNPILEDQFPVLSRLADKYPYSKSVRKAISIFPDAAWELEDEVDHVVQKLILQRANLLVVGNPGVGKSAVLKMAIRKIDNKSRKEKLGYTFWQIMPQRITAASKYLGEWQETVEEMIEDLGLANGILWVEQIVRLLQVGGMGPEDSVASFLISYLQQGKLQLVGEVTPQELESIRRLLPGFVENFQIVEVKELPENKIQSILSRIGEFGQSNLKIDIPKSSQELAYRLLVRYYPYESFPGKAVKFLSACVREARLADKSVISKEDVIRNFVQQTGMPELFLRDDLLLDKEDLDQFFKDRIVGQEAAIDQMTSVVKVFKAGLNNPHKPIQTMVFAGPTGVGKTASARALAEYFFGKGQKRDPLIRIDMSEFQHPGQIMRFIGGGNEVGKLVQDIRERPFSVLLLDEVEKADPSIFDTLLTVLDEGILVDAFGRVTNFRNTIIIMTTNLGASNRKSIGFSQEDDSSRYNAAIHSFFRPEFVNRIDSVIMFHSLKQEDIQAITLMELEQVKQREGFTKKGLELEFGEGVIRHLTHIGFDERYGARPLQRAVEEEIIAPLATWMLENPQVANCKLKIQYDHGLKVVR